MTISVLPHILQFKQPAGTSRGVYRTRKIWYIIIQREDSFGIGECAPLPALSCDDVPEYEEVIAEACRYAEASEEIPYHLLKDYPSILFGLETAFLSFKACATTGNPYHLFENAFSRGEKGIVINGLVWMGTFEEMQERMEEKLAQGFRCVKIKIGAIDWEREISLIRTLRQHYPRKVVELRVDANGGFTPEQAMSRLRELAQYDIHSIEQPIRQGQWETMAALCRETPIPIALDEELIGINDPEEKARLLDTIRPQYIILKPSLHGGLKGCVEWIEMAKERGIGYWATSALESNVGLNAIAQWAGSKELTMPQGLGTGQLFVDNYTPIHLEIKGDRIWCGFDKDREFWEDYRNFLQEWNSDDPTIEVNTSGSTGTPKTIRVEKERMKASARMTLKFLDLQENDTALLCMPLRYIAGKMMVVRALVGNLRLRLVAPSTHPLKDITVVPKFIALTPMQTLATLEIPEEKDLFIQIPKIIIGGGSISTTLHNALQECQGEVYSTYGMTETLSHIAMRRLNGASQSEWYHVLDRILISQDEDNCLCINAPSLCSTPLHTHDLCEINSEGEFRILGRKDNIICSGGIKLSLETIEAKLGDIGVPYQLTAIPDEHLGEALTLLYTGEKPLDLEVLKSRLTAYEIPKHFFLVETLPLTETGKPARKEARKLAEIIGLESKS